ncbi:acetylcholine receptor subunit alpha-like 2 [Palaemon carinicauda]|uniref:acetylcholine receptor subunit alpha-like 2 n=1 Tax=Palaemon carinicauda TaxID=392227 RepID=UPI0035B5A60C
MYYKVLILAFLFAAGVQGDKNVTKESKDEEALLKAEQTIRESLLKDYDKKVMPTMNTKVTIIEISIQDIKMRESDQSMEVSTRLSMLWDDPRLIWELNKHMDVGFLGMDPETIWTPDLAVYNGASQTHVPRSSMPMIVYPDDGTILYTSPYKFKFSCVMDLTYWPHDTHHCTLRLGSWVHQGHMLDLFLKDNKVEIDIPVAMTSSGSNISAAEWTIESTSVRREESHYPCCHESLVTILMDFVVKRNAPFYAWTVKLPVGCLSVLTVLLFQLPPTAGEKMILGGLCLISNLVYIGYASFIIGHAPSHSPLIIKMIGQQVVLVTLSLIVSTLIVRIAREPRSKGVPFFIKKIIVFLSYPLCLGNYRNLLTYSSHTFEFTSKSEELDIEDGSNNVNDLRRLSMGGCEWLLLSAVLDRFALFLYIAICIISLIRYNSVL